MIYYGQTDTGRVRQTNQDHFSITSVQGEETVLFVVCDGMGGAAGGSTASRTACITFEDHVKNYIEKNVKQKENDYERIMREALSEANEKVYKTAEQNPELAGMGTTLCAVLTNGKKVWALSVGDSRIYMFSHGEIAQISHDHSYVQALVDSGAITPDESRTHPNKNIITRAVGTAETVECDFFLMDFSMDALLICSDGLTNYVSDSELNEKFLQHTNIESLTLDYIQSANNAGGGDNITAVVIHK